MTTIKRPGYTITIEEPAVYVDNAARRRSGHMTHALAALDERRFIDFNSNCSAVRSGGHSAFGFVEYRTSEDAGKTYSDAKVLPISWEKLMDGMQTLSVEKAVATDTGRIVAVCLTNNAVAEEICCEPWDKPFVISSDDFGKTWSGPRDFTPYPGRPYAACYHHGTVFIMHFCNEHFLGSKPEHLYRLYCSTDNGETFTERAVIPFPDTVRRGYSALLFAPDGTLHAYAYNEADEAHTDHAVSHDEGRTWEALDPVVTKQGLRNPQMAVLDGVFIAHGRAGDAKGFILYTSLDGTNWDEGTKIVETAFPAGAYYSNNVTLSDEKGRFLLIQYSHPYDFTQKDWLGRVNVMHTVLRVIKP